MGLKEEAIRRCYKSKGVVSQRVQDMFRIHFRGFISILLSLANGSHRTWLVPCVARCPKQWLPFEENIDPSIFFSPNSA